MKVMVLSGGLKKLLKALQGRGIKRTIAYLLSYIGGIIFDIKYGTNTTSSVKIEDLKIESNNKKRAEDYEATQVLPLRKLFKELMIPKGKVFIDVGCGKGRVLLIASEFGFKELRGIEFSPELCKIATNNCSIYKRKAGISANFLIIESDICDYEIKDEDVFFVFNPFDAHVLAQVLENIRLSLLERKRRIWIIYRKPIHRFIIDEDTEFRKLKKFVFWGSDFLVHTNIGMEKA